MESNKLSRVCSVRRSIAGLLMAFGLFVGTQALVAHHAGTMFTAEVTEIAGTIKEFQFTNPHVWIQVMVEPEPGAAAQEWSVEWGSPNSLGRRGIRPSTFKAGADVTMRIRPMRDGSPAGGFADGTTVGRWE